MLPLEVAVETILLRHLLKLEVLSCRDYVRLPVAEESLLGWQALQVGVPL